MGNRRVRRVVICWTALSLGMGATSGFAAERVVRSTGQTIYAAAYSHVLMGTAKFEFPVAATLVVRNTDPASGIVVTAVDYRDSKGKHLRHYVDKPIVIGPFSSTEFVVKESDSTGGHSPCFIVQWEATARVNAPIVETLMMGGRGSQGISFVGRAWVIEERGDVRDEAKPEEPSH